MKKDKEVLGVLGQFFTTLGVGVIGGLLWDFGERGIWDVTG
jgi:hypothetical protein